MNFLPLLQHVADPSAESQARQVFFQAGTALFSFGGGVAMIVSLLGILYMTMVIAPNFTQRSSVALREHNIKSFFIGIPVVGVLSFIGLILHQAAPLFVLTGLILGVMVILGYAAAAEDIGRRLFWACGKEGSRASHLAVGWLIFAFGSLFPVIGWFLIFPYVTLSGVGALVTGFFPPKAAARADAKDIEFEK